MINILIPITQKNKDYVSLLNCIKKEIDLNILVGIDEEIFFDILGQIGEVENLKIFKFQSGSNREAIINSLQKYIEDGSIFILRKPITLVEFNNFILSEKDVTTCKRNYTKIQAFIFNLWQKILRFILGLKFYDGDTSAIFFGLDISTVLYTSRNLSFASRANRFRSIEQSTVEVKGEKVKPLIQKSDTIKYILTVIISLIVGAVVTVCVSVFTNVNILVGLLLTCLDVMCVAISAIMLILLVFNLFVGKKEVGQAFELQDFNENSDDEEEEEEEVNEN